MGYELKRVALDFSWPHEKVWSGYKNPHQANMTDCPHCGGTAHALVARHLKDLWYGRTPFRPEDRGSAPFTPCTPAILQLARANVEAAPGYYGKDDAAVAREAQRLCALYNGSWSHHLNELDVAALLAEDRLWALTRPRLPDGGWGPRDPAYVPTPAEVNAWSLSGLGHDSFNAWICIQAECARLAVPFYCEHCEGEGSIWDSAEAKNRYETWVRTDPPAGAGYQLWETVTEGSPVSPVFATPEALAQWLASNSEAAMSAEGWLKFIEEEGSAPTLVVVGDAVMPGVQAVAARVGPQV